MAYINTAFLWTVIIVMELEILEGTRHNSLRHEVELSLDLFSK